MGDIKPCPFCGATGDNVGVSGRNYGVTCYSCGVWMPSRVSTDITRNHGALEGWNRRVDVPKLPYTDAFLLEIRMDCGE